MRCQCGVEGYRRMEEQIAALKLLSSLAVVIRVVNADGILMLTSDTYSKGPSAGPIYGATGSWVLIGS